MHYFIRTIYEWFYILLSPQRHIKNYSFDHHLSNFKGRFLNARAPRMPSVSTWSSSGKSFSRTGGLTSLHGGRALILRPAWPIVQNNGMNLIFKFHFSCKVSVRHKSLQLRSSKLLKSICHHDKIKKKEMSVWASNVSFKTNCIGTSEKLLTSIIKQNWRQESKGVHVQNIQNFLIADREPNCFNMLRINIKKYFLLLIIIQWKNKIVKCYKITTFNFPS